MEQRGLTWAHRGVINIIICRSRALRQLQNFCPSNQTLPHSLQLAFFSKGMMDPGTVLVTGKKTGGVLSGSDGLSLYGPQLTLEDKVIIFLGSVPHPGSAWRVRVASGAEVTGLRVGSVPSTLSSPDLDPPLLSLGVKKLLQAEDLRAHLRLGRAWEAQL